MMTVKTKRGTGWFGTGNRRPENRRMEGLR